MSVTCVRTRRSRAASRELPARAVGARRCPRIAATAGDRRRRARRWRPSQDQREQLPGGRRVFLHGPPDDLAVGPSEDGGEQDDAQGYAAAAQQTPQRGLVVPGVGSQEQPVDQPPHQQREHDRAADDDQRAQCVLHAPDRNWHDGPMNIMLFHSAYGLRPAVHAAADRLRGAGHEVIVPDLFEGRTAETVEAGMGSDEFGNDELLRRACWPRRPTPSAACLRRLVPGRLLAQTLALGDERARGLLLLHGTSDIADDAAVDELPVHSTSPTPTPSSRPTG